MLTLNMYLFPGREIIKSLDLAIFMVNNPTDISNRIPVNFVKKICVAI